MNHKTLRAEVEKIVERYGNRVDPQGMADGFDECVEELLSLISHKIMKAIPKEDSREDELFQQADINPGDAYELGKKDGRNQALSEFKKALHKVLK